jgi:hypothetical protein
MFSNAPRYSTSQVVHHKYEVALPETPLAESVSQRSLLDEVFQVDVWRNHPLPFVMQDKTNDLGEPLMRA